MGYLDVISLDEAKIYLKIDEDQEETNSEITSMLKAAFRYVERITNILATPKDKEYFPTNGCVRVYDYPINTSIEGVRKVNYSLIPSTEPITLNVGYATPEDVPDDYKQAVLGIVKAEFYAQDEEEDFKNSLPSFVTEFIQTSRRFIV